MSAPSLAKFVTQRPWLQRMLTPVAKWYTNAAGYRQLGLKADDLIPEESETVLHALKRLPPKESYDRAFRIRRAVQCSLSHQILPAEDQVTPEEDTPYLSPIIAQIEAEAKERTDLESLSIKNR